jgi:pyruvate dehydrogenase E2 component (dihydrolipoamide acetyltransferase)
MTNAAEIQVPDIGDFDSVEVIEVLVAVGDTVEAEQSLITLESDKASMEIPSSHAGTIQSIAVAVGDKVSQGDVIVTVAASAPTTESAAAAPAPAQTSEPDNAPAAAAPATGSLHTVTVPDIGDFDEVEVIEILVNTGDQVDLEQSLLTLESDKASMEIPSTAAGEITRLMVSVGDKISAGTEIVEISTTADTAAATPAPEPATEAPAPSPQPAPAAAPKADTAARQQNTRSPTQRMARETGRRAHASPGVRKFARQLGVDLSLVAGSGHKGRVLKSDVKTFVKSSMESSGTAYGSAQTAAGLVGGAGIPPIPEVDFSVFGETERVELTRINRLTAQNLHRAWLNLPLVTYHEEADITEMEAFRQSIKPKAAEKGIRVTGLVFHVKALAAALKAFPRFNSSLSADGESLFYKKYFNIGIAVDTPAGLVVPVLKDADKKSIYTLSEEMSELSKKARDKKLKPDDMQGACMTISSLGGIGGTAFTPIVNPPEVAILGISRAKMQPVWNGDEFIPRLLCPLDVTYDHRVIDGAEGARFMAHYCELISDVRNLLL